MVWLSQARGRGSHQMSYHMVIRILWKCVGIRPVMAFAWTFGLSPSQLLTVEQRPQDSALIRLFVPSTRLLTAQLFAKVFTNERMHIQLPRIMRIFSCEESGSS